MKDFADFKEFLRKGAWKEVLDKATDNANRRVKEECSQEDDLSKSYTFNRFITEGTIIYTLEKYHEWLNQEN